MKQTIIADLPENWAEIDAWRSIVAALALANGGDPAVAAARHRDWCRAMGYEPASDPRSLSSDI